MATVTVDRDASAEDAAVPATSDVTTITKKRKNELEQDSSKLKRVKTSIASVAGELLCPITQELPIDPVTAEDGHVYERESIEAHIERQGNDVKSPMTNEPMGVNIFPAVHVRNTIQHLIESGIIEGDIAETWKQRTESKILVDGAIRRANDGDARAMCDLGHWHLTGEHGLPYDESVAYVWYKAAADLNDARGAAKVQEIEWKREVEMTKTRAENGDSEAMYLLGHWHHDAKNGLSRDLEEAFKWYKKASDKKNVMGMARAGSFLVYGRGVEANVSQGIFLTSIAAERGLDYACYCLGQWHYHGMHGLPKDMTEAKYWTQKVIDGSCTVKQLSPGLIEKARRRLQRIENGHSS